MTKDMTKGSPMKLILGFAVPLFFGFLFQQFYNLVDTVIVGRFLGVDELASVGATGSINFLGIPATFLYNTVSGVIRALGDSRTPVVFLVLSSFVNIGLDLLFIINLQLGVAGAALATVLAQVLAGIGCLLFMIWRFRILHIQKGEWRPDGHMMMVLCGMGIPMGLQYSITAIGTVVLQSAINTLGSAAVASVTAGNKVSCFLACPFDALGSTMATYSGQNVGANKPERLGQGLKSCVLIGAVYSVLAFLIVLVGGERLAGLFVESSETVIIGNVKQFLLYNTASYFLLALVNIVRFMIQGMGFPTFAILAGVLEMIARSVAGVMLVPLLGFTGVCLGSPVAWILADAFLIPAYFIVKTLLQKRMGTGKE